MDNLSKIEVFEEKEKSKKYSLRELNKLNNLNISENNKNFLDIMINTSIERKYTTFYPILKENFNFSDEVCSKIIFIIRDIAEDYKDNQYKKLVEERCKKLLNIILKIKKKEKENINLYS